MPESRAISDTVSGDDIPHVGEVSLKVVCSNIKNCIEFFTVISSCVTILGVEASEALGLVNHTFLSFLLQQFVGCGFRVYKPASRHGCFEADFAYLYVFSGRHWFGCRPHYPQYLLTITITITITTLGVLVERWVTVGLGCNSDRVPIRFEVTAPLSRCSG